MAKRGATRELNHDNWDEDEETEEAGTFQKASDEALQGRVIKQARRRLGASDDGAKKGFSGFAGFGAPKAASSSVFGNLTFTKQADSETKSASPFSNLTFTKQTPTTTTGTSSTENGTSKSKDTDEESPSEKEYLASLKALNESVSTWISDHVKKNPYCVLTPIFQDYEKHLQGLESKRAADKSKVTTTSTAQFKFTPVEATTGVAEKKPTFSFGKTDSDDKSKTSESKPETTKPSLNFFEAPSAPVTSSTATTPSSTGFSFGLKTSTSPTASTFSFGASSAATTPSTLGPPPFTFKSPTSSTTSTTTASSSSSSSLFSFGSTPAGTTPTTSGFSFGFASAKPAEKKEDEEEKDGGEEDEDEPPKVEVKPVQEDDAFYSIRCKLFYKKEGNFVEKGIGMLHLKKIKDDKTQLVIRADTSLGTILLNVLLQPQMTTQRVGKNNVMMVCVPNPPIDPKTAPAPTPMLLRVKTDTEADELLQKLNDSKK